MTVSNFHRQVCFISLATEKRKKKKKKRLNYELINQSCVEMCADVPPPPSAAPRQACAWVTQQRWGPEPGSIPPPVCTGCRPLEPGTGPAACGRRKPPQTMVSIQKRALEMRGRRLPVSSPWHKHFVKGKLPMQVFLNDIHPFGIPGLIIQLLTEHTKGQSADWNRLCHFTDSIWCWAEYLSVLSQESRGVKTGRVKADGYPEAQGIRKVKRRTERGAWLTWNFPWFCSLLTFPPDR